MKPAVADPIDDTAHALFGVRHDMAHIRTQQVPSIPLRQMVQFACAGLVRRQLSLDIRNVHIRAASRMCSGKDELTKLQLTEPTVLHQEKIIDDDTFFFEPPRVGRHGAGGGSADISVMAAIGNEESDLSA